MADEHVIKIEFEGDDGSNPSRSDERAQQEQSQSREEQRRTNDENRRAYDDARSRFEDEVRRSAAESPDSPLPHGDDGRDRTPEPEVEVVDERPVYSQSRDLVPYDPAFANEQANLHRPQSEYGPGPTAGAAVADAAVDVAGAAAGGGGAGLPPSIVFGAEAAGAAGGGGLAAAGAAVLAIAEPVAIVVAGLAGMAVAVIGATEALSAFHDHLLEQFENLNGEIASARAQQEIELIQKRVEVAEGIAPGASATIAAQTEMEKQMIELNGRIAQFTEIFLKPLYEIAAGILDGLNAILDWLFGPLSSKTSNFQQGAIDFLAGLPGALVGKQDFRMKHPPRPKNGGRGRKP